MHLHLYVLFILMISGGIAHLLSKILNKRIAKDKSKLDYNKKRSILLQKTLRTCFENELNHQKNLAEIGNQVAHLQEDIFQHHFLHNGKNR